MPLQWKHFTSPCVNTRHHLHNTHGMESGIKFQVATLGFCGRSERLLAAAVQATTAAHYMRGWTGGALV